MDAILIEQVIINILENAVQHAVGMTKLSLNVSVKADNAVFEIRDNGAGIPDNVLKNIFKGIYTDHEMPSDCKRSNAGIGLSVCSTIIKAHGGTINAYNAKDGKDIKGMKIALPEEFFADSTDDEVKNAVLAAAKKYEEMGATLVDCSMKSLKYAVSAYYLVASAEAASNLSRFDGIKYGLRGEGRTFDEMIRDSRTRGFGDEVKRRILLGNYALSSGYYDAYYLKALALKQQIIKEYNEIFENADVILTPTAPTVAYKIGEQETDPVKMYLADICTVTVNIASLPAISVPCGYNADGMPIGMSLVGRKWDEATLIQTADAFEKTFERRYSEV